MQKIASKMEKALGGKGLIRVSLTFYSRRDPRFSQISKPI